MKITKITSNKRYLSEIPEFQNGLPLGVIAKGDTDVGGSFICLQVPYNYIIVCPNIDLIYSLEADVNNIYKVLPVDGGTTNNTILEYLSENTIHKIAVTYDSFIRLTSLIKDPKKYRVVIDEYHEVLAEFDYRESAINDLLSALKKYFYSSWLSATPIIKHLEPTFLHDLPHYEIEWEDRLKIAPKRIKTPRIIKALCRIIELYKTELILQSYDGIPTKVKELHIFINSVKSIKQILDTMKLSPDEVRICCSTNKRNILQIGNYKIKSVTTDPICNINFYTKKCFKGCNIFSNNALIIVASDANRKTMVTDVSSDLFQIKGRFRQNKQYDNCFKHILIHLYNFASDIQSKEEFESEMKQKELDANMLISGMEALTEQQRSVFLNRLEKSVENDIVNIDNGTMTYSEMKRKFFEYKYELRSSYKNELSIMKSYSKKFVMEKSQYWNNFQVDLAKVTSITYEDLIREFYSEFDESYYKEYPEFQLYKQYLTLQNCNSLKFIKSKMISRCNDLQQLEHIYKQSITTSKFYSSKELKEILTKKCIKANIKIIPKASYVESFTWMNVTKKTLQINGKKTNGYHIQINH